MAPTDTALAHRREHFQLEIDTEWRDLSKNDEGRAEVLRTWSSLSPFFSGFYANLTNSDDKAVHDNFGPNRARLMDIKEAV